MEKEKQNIKENTVRVGKYTSDFKQKSKLGSGGFGSVYKGYEIKNSQNQVAIKIIRIQEGEKMLNKIKDEALNMINAKSQGTVQILAAGKIQGQKFQGGHYFAIVMEKMDGSLKNLLQQKGKLTQKEAIQWIKKIVQCYKSLYDSNILHRDLKPDNILYKLTDKNVLIFKITDFGLSRDIQQSNRQLSIGSGSPNYMSPQQSKKGDYTNKTDVYSLGTILFELLNGVNKTPKTLDIVDHLSFQFDDYQFQKCMKIHNISKICQNFIKKCIQAKQQNRFSWDDIFNHQIFQEKNFKKEQVSNNLFDIQTINTQQKIKNKNKIKQLLQNVKKIKITPKINQGRYDVNKQQILGWHLDDQNPNLTHGYGQRFSNQILPIKKQSFYFCIKAIDVNYQGRYMTLGLYFHISCSYHFSTNKKNFVGYDMAYRKINKFGQQTLKQPQFENKIVQFPSDLIVFISQQNKTISFIYNDKIQVVIPLEKQMIQNKNDCHAYITIWGDRKNKSVQFT